MRGLCAPPSLSSLPLPSLYSPSLSCRMSGGKAATLTFQKLSTQKDDLDKKLAKQQKRIQEAESEEQELREAINQLKLAKRNQGGVQADREQTKRTGKEVRRIVHSLSGAADACTLLTPFKNYTCTIVCTIMAIPASASRILTCAHSLDASVRSFLVVVLPYDPFPLRFFLFTCHTALSHADLPVGAGEAAAAPRLRQD